jgi:uncharacterized protein YggE
MTFSLTKHCIRYALAAGLAAPLIGSGAVQAQPLPPPSISISGEATVSAAPDLAEIDGGVTTEAKTAREATDANNIAMTAVVAALKNVGIAEKDMQTSRLSLQPQSVANRNNEGPVRIVGYRATNHVTVRIRDVSKVASVIDTLTGAGANSISGISFRVTQASKLLDEARTQALADARRKAEIYAKAANVTLGAPISITEAGASGPVPMLRAKFAADSAGAPVAPGEETLHVGVSVSYEIKPAKP